MNTKITLDAAVQVQTKQKTTRKRVGIIGGTFNPPHLGHLLMADQVYHQLGLDGIYFMPSHTPPHRHKKSLMPPTYRREMVQLAIQDHAHFFLETREIERGGKSYTIDTMRELISEHPETDYYFIIGGDMVAYLPQWAEIDALVQMVQFVGVGRPHYEKHSAYPMIWVDSPEIDISSTLLRQKIASGCSVRYLLPDRVLTYISEKGLYSS